MEVRQHTWDKLGSGSLEASQQESVNSLLSQRRGLVLKGLEGELPSTWQEHKAPKGDPPSAWQRLKALRNKFIVASAAQRDLLSTWHEALENELENIKSLLSASEDRFTWPGHKVSLRDQTRTWQEHVRNFREVPATINYVKKDSRVRQQHSAGKYLPMIINGRQIIDARHDTGAERGNYIDKNLADSLDLQIQQGKSGCKSFSLGNGKVVRSVGKVKATCAFAKETHTRVKCWFYVLNNLAAPLIMGSEFLEKTKTMSTFTNRLENRLTDKKTMPMLNFIGFTHASKRRFAASIDGRQTHINADSGSDLDLMSSSYVRDHGYKIDRRWECRKRIQVADSSVVESIGQVRAKLTLADGSSHVKLFDVLPGLKSDVLLGEISLHEIEAFTVHESSFVEVFAGEHHSELFTLGYLGKVNEFLVRHLRRGKRDRTQELPSLAKQQDDFMMDKLHAKDLEVRRSRLENNGLITQGRAQTNEGGERQRQDTLQVPLQRQNVTASSTP